MNLDYLGAIITFIYGFVIAILNYLLSRAILKKQPNKYAVSTIIRQLSQIIYLVAVYFVSTVVPCDTIYMLVGAVIGVTLPMFYFTHKLLQLNQTIKTNNKDKEGEDNG